MKIFRLLSSACLISLSLGATAMDKEGEHSGYMANDTYKFDIIKNLEFEPDRGQKSSGILKGANSYPQGFYIDRSSNQLFVLRYTMKKPNTPLVDIYSWDSLNYKKTFFLKGTSSRISEGIYVDSKDNKSLLYVRGKDSLLEFAIPSDAKDGASLSGESVIDAHLAQSFSFGKDKIFVEYYDPKKTGNDQSRGQYLIYDKNFSKTGTITFNSTYAGTTKSQDNKEPKHQGFSAYPQGFVMSMGGFWKVGSPVTPYSYQGFNFFNTNGELVSSRYIRPDAMLEILKTEGFVADRIENEGVQVLEDGTIITLNVIQISPKKPGGLLVLKVDDSKSDKNINRLDLSPAAVEKN